MKKILITKLDRRNRLRQQLGGKPRRWSARIKPGGLVDLPRGLVLALELHRCDKVNIEPDGRGRLLVTKVRGSR